MNIMENWKIVVCPKCHKEFKDVILFPHHGRKCPHCGEIQMVYTIESSKRNNIQNLHLFLKDSGNVFYHLLYLL